MTPVAIELGHLPDLDRIPSLAKGVGVDDGCLSATI
jgi:hypothetical protein